MNDVTVMSRTMLTRPHLERVAREADLDLGAKTPREFDAVLAVARAPHQNRDRRARTSTRSASRTRSARLPCDVVDKLLDSFVEDTLGSGQEDSQQAEKTLKKELEDYERRLTESEDRLKEFKRQNVGLMPDEHGDYYAQLQAASADLAAVQQATRIANEKAASLARQLEGEEPVFGIMSSTPGGGRGSSIRRPDRVARADVGPICSSNSPRSTPRSSGSISSCRSFAQSARLNLPSKPEGDLPVVSNPLDINPVYQSLKIQRSKVEVELASLRAELADKQAKVDRLEENGRCHPAGRSRTQSAESRLRRRKGALRADAATLGRSADRQTREDRYRSGSVSDHQSAVRTGGSGRSTSRALSVRRLCRVVGGWTWGCVSVESAAPGVSSVSGSG